MTHPACCLNPDTCTLTYKEHIYGFGIGAAALPTRAINRTRGHPDEPVAQTLIREKRWDRDMDAYKRLHRQGHRPPAIEGAALRERIGSTDSDMSRPITIDYTDAS